MQPTIKIAGQEMNREQAAQIVDEQVLMLRKMNKQYGAKYDQLAKECAEVGARSAYARYMPERPQNENARDWSLWMMHREDVVIGAIKAW